MAEIDIEVKQGILATYHNYTYKPPQVFAEFIDNAIQSYEDNKNSILSMDPNFKLRIDIDIEWEADTDNIVRAKKVVVHDNAAGMTIQKFSDAFKSADKNVIRGGLNEFGMGMKVAACWLGNKWKVETKSITEQITHVLEIDVEEVSKGNIKQLSSIDVNTPDREHGTRIVITDMWPQIKRDGLKELDGLKSLKEGIASIYRYYLRRGEILIYVNGDLLEFENYEVLEAPAYNNPSGSDIVWKKTIDIDLDGTGRYKATGFIGLLKDMSDKNRGVVFLRRNRVVMGFDPTERTVGRKVMGQPGSFRYRRVFGELEVTGFDVAFGKNQIIDIDQLEALMFVVAGVATINGVSILTQGDKYRVKPKPTQPKPEIPKPVVPKPMVLETTTENPIIVSEPITTSVSPKPILSKPVSLNTGDTAIELPITSQFKYAGNEWTFNMDPTFEITDLFANDASHMNEHILGCKINLNHPFFKMYGVPTKQTIEIIKALSIANFTSTIDGRGSVSKFLAEFEDLLND